MSEKNAIDILKSLVGFDTTSSKSNLDLIEFIESYLNNHKIKSTLVYDSSGKKANLFATIGSGNEENNLIKLSKELSIEKEVIFLKNINENLKLALIAASNLFLMPSRIDKKSVEGFGISYIEAASYAVGSIGGKDGGASDAIAHNKTGLICDGNDLNSIYEAIINFFMNDRFNEFGKAAQEFSENFHWNKVVKNYLKLINE